MHSTRGQKYKCKILTTARYRCKTCKKCFSSKQSLLTHFNSHTGKKTYKCPDGNCERSYASYYALRVHIRNIHPEQLKRKKKKKDEDEFPEKLLCSKCPKFFSSMKHVLNHENETHSRDECLCCEICSKIFTKKSSVERHRQQVHRIGDPLATCEICGKSPKDMKRHMLSHDRSQLAQCEFCYKVFKTKRYMKDHLKICKKK